jgi:hypothetical protein
LIIHSYFLLAHFAQTELYKTDKNSVASKSSDLNFQKQNLLELAIKWNCFDQATDLLAELQYFDVSTAFLCTVIH